MKKSLLIATMLLSLTLTGCIFDKEKNNKTKDNDVSEQSQSSEEEKPSTVDINPPSYF